MKAMILGFAAAAVIALGTAAVLNSVGYDLIAIYRPGGEVIFSSRRFSSVGTLPEKTGLGLFKIMADDKRWIMAGAVQSVQINGQPANLLVGSWLDDSYLGGIKVVTSLDVRLFSDFDGELEPVVQTHPDHQVVIPDAIRVRLDAGEDEIFDADAGAGGAYRAVYSGFRGIDGKLGGGWLKANRVFAVECYDPRGAFLGNATHAAEGAWRLPKSGVEMLVRLKTATGAGMHFMVRP